MIAVDEKLSYDCDKRRPVHLASKRWSMRHGNEVPLKQSFGAVSSLMPSHFVHANGYSNKYWGWGAEDDDLLKRLMSVGHRPIPRRTEAHYNWHMVDHGSSRKDEGNPTNPDRFGLKNTAVERMRNDGLNTLNYTIIEDEDRVLFKKVIVDIGRNAERFEPDRIYEEQLE